MKNAIGMIAGGLLGLAFLASSCAGGDQIADEETSVNPESIKGDQLIIETNEGEKIEVDRIMQVVFPMNFLDPGQNKLLVFQDLGIEHPDPEKQIVPCPETEGRVEVQFLEPSQSSPVQFYHLPGQRPGLVVSYKYWSIDNTFYLPEGSYLEDLTVDETQVKIVYQYQATEETDEVAKPFDGLAPPFYETEDSAGKQVVVD